MLDDAYLNFSDSIGKGLNIYDMTVKNQNSPKEETELQTSQNQSTCFKTPAQQQGNWVAASQIQPAEAKHHL